MNHRVSCCFVAIVLALALSAPSQAQLAPYNQDFESLDQGNPAALFADGWLIFGNVFFPDWNYAYGYGVFPAPNGGNGFSAIASGEGGAEQGAQQLSIYNDYNNGDHGAGFFIEANVFQEQVIGAADIGNSWMFEFDAKRGNIEGDTEARAFFKTLDPNNNFALTNFIWVDMTNVPTDWDRYSLSIFLDAGLEGQILQFGFLSTTTFYQGSGVFYDNLDFRLQPKKVSLDLHPGSCPNPLNGRSRGLLSAALLGSADLDINEIDVDSLRLEGVAPINSSYDDVAGPFGGDLCGCTDAGPDGFTDLELKFSTKDIIATVGQLPPGETTMTLTGTLLDGTPIEGQDCVVSVGSGRGRPENNPNRTSGTFDFQPR